LESLLLIPSLILGFLLWQEKRDRSLERKERDLKEIGLLNRIQAPEVARFEPTADLSDEPLYLPFDDDAAHDRYVEQRATGEVV
jgi:hypothetical protein